MDQNGSKWIKMDQTWINWISYIPEDWFDNVCCTVVLDKFVDRIGVIWLFWLVVFPFPLVYRLLLLHLVNELRLAVLETIDELTLEAADMLRFGFAVRLLTILGVEPRLPSEPSSSEVKPSSGSSAISLWNKWKWIKLNRNESKGIKMHQNVSKYISLD